MKTVLVTGGTGYVGKHAVEALRARGVAVIAVDIVPPQERGFSFSPGIEFRKHDLRIPAEARAALRGADIVLHLGADIGSLTYMHEHQADILTNNSAIDAALYPAAKEQGIPWIIYSSSSMVFQHPPQFPYKEEDIAMIHPPTNVYGFAKLIGEYFCRAYAAQHGLCYTILRYHNIYGPGENSKGATPGDIHVIPALIQKVLSGQYPLELLGNPQATRSFTYIDDAINFTVDIVLRALQKDESVRNQDFNIGNDTFITILELAEMIWSGCGDGRPFRYKEVGTKGDTALRREVDITKIKKLGWRQDVSLKEGLALVISWMRANQGKSV